MLKLKDDGGTFRDRLSLADAREVAARWKANLPDRTLRLAEPRTARPQESLASIHVDLTRRG